MTKSVLVDRIELRKRITLLEQFVKAWDELEYKRDLFEDIFDSIKQLKATREKIGVIE